MEADFDDSDWLVRLDATGWLKVPIDLLPYYSLIPLPFASEC